MAFMSQERKAELAPAILTVCRKHGVKATLSVRHHSTLVLTLKSGPVDFAADYVRGDRAGFDSQGSINGYWYKEHYRGRSLAFLSELIPALNVGNHNRSDLQSDYHDVGWYTDIRVGSYEKPYEVIRAPSQRVQAAARQEVS